ncbi:TonB-dependent receptor [Pleomorphomonas carboxyditropha]|uniref:TonB-dependent receptor n=1 Tax=Pleomorphomonas carboxyditropha TaxID=2023338 RepID=UPI0013FDB083|nr:TonB-dependent receptor [Pleomorphomonas carboxyditropha]
MAATSRLLVGVAGCALAAASVVIPRSALSQAIENTSTVAATRQFSIPAQPLTDALGQFGRQSGLQVAFPAEVAQGLSANAVVGTFTPRDALARLLQGTGVSWRITAQGAVIVGGQTTDASDDGAVTADGSLLLDTITVTGQSERAASSGSGYQGTPDWVYETPSSVGVISREAIQSAPSRNARDLLDNVAGVYASRAEAQKPGISVNIRGLQDNDRVGMMIDGARQSFQRNGHGATQQTYVDTAFVRAIEVEKSGTSGAGSLGTLGGSVNFRTIVADDLIQPDRKWGVELNGTTGTNNYHFDGSLAAAIRLSDSFSVLGGVSHKNIGAYEVGKNGELRAQTTTATGDTFLFSGQEVLSTILKAEADITDDAKLSLSWVRNESDFSTGNYSTFLGDTMLLETKQNVVNDTFATSLDWNPHSNLVDLKARLYYNQTDHEDNAYVIDGVGRNYKMETPGGSIENTSRVDTSFGLLSLNYGAEAFRDDGKSNNPAVIIDGMDQTDYYNGGNPAGKRDVAGGFFNAKLEHDDWLTVQGGFRYDWYRASGSTTIYGNETRDIIQTIEHPEIPCRQPFPTRPDICIGGQPAWTEYVYGDPYYPRYGVNINRSDGAFLPTFTVAVKPYDWLQPFVKYSESFRPPTVMESFLNSGHQGVSNSYAPNPYLEPESAETWELGVNISKDALFKADDSLRLKVVGFYREVEDYIALGRTYNEDAARYYTSPVNLSGATRMKGVEVEANYDARAWYLGGTLTYNEADYPRWYGSGAGLGYLGAESSVIFVQPEIRVALDGGVRLFDEKLTLGARMTYVGKTEPTIGSLQNNYKLDDYTLFDLYGSYAINENAKLRVSVTNLTDKAYVSALGADYYAMPGRTITASLNLKF